MEIDWKTLLMITFPLFSDIAHGFLIYAIIWKSPSKMKFIRLFLLKLVICGMITIHLMIWIIMPDFYQPQFPLIMFKINNTFFSDTVLLAAAFVTGCFIGLTFSSLGEECVMRFVLTYNIHHILKFGHGAVFIFFVILECIIAAIGATVFALLVVDGNANALQYYIQNHNAAFILNDFDLEKDTIIFFSPDSPYFLPIICFSLIVMTAYYLIIILLSYLTHRKIMKGAEMMSAENYMLQKRLTRMLFLQLVLPTIFVGVPITFVAICYTVVFVPADADLRYREIYGRFNWAYPTLGGMFFIYPLLNTVFTTIIIKPYRTAILQLFDISCRFCGRARASSAPVIRVDRRFSQQVHTIMTTNAMQKDQSS